jgi:multisubunit Na+/H+ antiporter MnhB subunit
MINELSGISCVVADGFESAIVDFCAILIFIITTIVIYLCIWTQRNNFILFNLLASKNINNFIKVDILRVCQSDCM